MGRTVSIRFKTEQNTLTAMKQVLDAVNKAQRKVWHSIAEDQGLNTIEFLHAEKQKENWSNGARIHSTDFTTFAILFKMDGNEKAILINDCGCVNASMGFTEENADFMNKVMDELEHFADETLRLYHEDECQRTVHSKTVTA
jgi:mRNA-degrading endonuclease RelE of RelBE toxin-antitoxin system